MPSYLEDPYVTPGALFQDIQQGSKDTTDEGDYPSGRSQIQEEPPVQPIPPRIEPGQYETAPGGRAGMIAQQPPQQNGMTAAAGVNNAMAGPLTQAQTQTIQRLQNGLSELDNKVFSGDLLPQEAAGPKQKIQSLLAPLMQKQEATKSMAMQQGIAQMMHASAAQAVVQSVARQARAQQFQKEVATYVDPITGAIAHYAEVKPGHMAEIKFERDGADRDRYLDMAQQATTTEEPPPSARLPQPNPHDYLTDAEFQAANRRWWEQEAPGSTKESASTPAPDLQWTGYEGMDQTYRPAPPTQLPGQMAQAQPFNLDNATLDQIRQRANQTIPRLQGYFPNARAAAMAQQQRQSQVSHLMSQMLSEQWRRRHEQAMAQENIRRGQERMSQFQEKMEERRRIREKDWIDTHMKIRKQLAEDDARDAAATKPENGPARPLINSKDLDAATAEHMREMGLPGSIQELHGIKPRGAGEQLPAPQAEGGTPQASAGPAQPSPQSRLAATLAAQKVLQKSARSGSGYPGEWIPPPGYTGQLQQPEAPGSYQGWAMTPP